MKKLIYRSCCFLCTTIIFVALVINVMRSALHVYPDWFLVTDFFNMVKQSVRHIHTSINLTEKHPIPERGPLFVLETQKRYLGEDAMFSCGMIFNGIISEVSRVLWIKNNEVVVNGTKRYIAWKVDTFSEFRVDRVTTNLTIYSVTEDDFGIYQCYVVFWDSVSPEFSKENIAHLYYKIQNQYWIGEVHLLQEKPSIRTLFIVPGTLVTVSVLFRHLGEIDDFSVSFTRNGQDIQSFDTQCSYSAQVYAYLLHTTGISVAYNSIELRNATVDHWKTSIGIIRSCISPSMYGMYQIRILRKVYNKFDGIQRIEKIDYPTKMNIKPKESTIVTENISKNKTRAVVGHNDDCWSNEELEQESCKYLKPLVVSLFDKNILYESVITRNIVILLFVAILISWILLFFIWPFFWWKSLQLDCVLQMSGNQGLAGIQVNPDIQYHLYISSSSFFTDRSFIALNILPALTRLKLKVFVGQDDIPPGNLELTEISNAINKSIKCLVIISDKYVESAIQNDFEINCILKTCSKCGLLIVNVDNCQIHEIFDKMYTVINCTRDGLSEQDKTRLMQWAVRKREMIPEVTQKYCSSTFYFAIRWTRCLIKVIVLLVRIFIFIFRWVIYLYSTYLICILYLSLFVLMIKYLVLVRSNSERIVQFVKKSPNLV